MGLALMEEIQIVDGRITNPSFTDYLIPTILDTPPMPIEVLEYADPHAPYGLRGVGEAPPSRRSGRRRGDPGRHRSGPAPGPDPARGRDPHPMTRPRLTAADLAEVERILAPADAALARDYLGDRRGSRCTRSTSPPTGAAGSAPGPHDRAPPSTSTPPTPPRWRAVGADLDQVAAVWPLLLAKLEREPVEDLRIDLEDGYRGHPDDEEDAQAVAAVRAVAADPPPYWGVRFKSFEAPTRAAGCARSTWCSAPRSRRRAARRLPAR